MHGLIWAPIFAASLLIGMLLMMDIGRRAGRRSLARDPEGAMSGIGAVEGAVFALFGLLIAFTFAGAASRFDARGHVIAEEANAIGTAYLRLDLLPGSVQPALRGLFRDYLDSRLDAYRKLPDMAAAETALARSAELQGAIWTQAVAASRAQEAHPDAAKLVLPALNEMIDITTTRAMASMIHPPLIIYALLFAVGLGCSLIAGYGMAAGKHRSWIHILGFVLIIVISTYVILDIEYPRLGFIRVDKYDQVLMELRQSMK